MNKHEKREQFLAKILMKKTRNGYWNRLGYREGPRKCHTLLVEHLHFWTPEFKPQTVLEEGAEETIDELFVTFSSNSVKLLRGYTWNGSNLVGDTPATLRASALHDAWWQAMKHGLYSCESREKADGEYLAICQEDGFGARLRDLGLSIGRKIDFPSCNANPQGNKGDD